MYYLLLYAATSRSPARYHHLTPLENAKTKHEAVSSPLKKSAHFSHRAVSTRADRIWLGGDKSQTPPRSSYLGKVELADFTADVLGQIAGEGDHPCQLLGVPLDKLQIRAGNTNELNMRCKY